MCLLKYVLNCEQHFSYFDLDYPTTGLARVYCIEKMKCLATWTMRTCSLQQHSALVINVNWKDLLQCVLSCLSKFHSCNIYCICSKLPIIYHVWGMGCFSYINLLAAW
jgi:hypothetical protein